MTTLAGLEQSVRACRGRLDREAGEATAVAREGQATQREVQRLKDLVLLHERTATVLLSIGEEAQETARAQVEALVTKALRVVFGDAYSFHLVPGEARGTVTVDFVLRSKYGDREVDTPVMDARGGGMAAVVGFVLRLVVLLLTPGARKFLALDESFAHVSASYETSVAEFLREVADKAGVQILLVTHSNAYSDQADVKVRMVLGEDGVTEVHMGETE